MGEASSGRLGAVIVNYQSARLLQDCLTSLPGSEVIGLVVIVDNSTSYGPDAGILEDIADLDDRVVLIRSAGNVGFAAAVNTGVRAASSRGAVAVWILNPDVRAAPGAAETLLAAMDDLGPAIVSPLILSDFGDDTLIAYAGGSVDLRTGRVEHWLYREPLTAAPAHDVEVSFMTGAAMMTTVATFEALGGFREDLFLYWEDADLSLRATRAGVKLVVVPAARVWHKQGGSADSRSDRFYYHNQRNRLVVAWTVGHRSPWGLVLGRGLPETLRLIVRPLVRDRGHTVRKTCRSVAGLAAGVLTVRRLRRMSTPALPRT
jgi:N-acetylglucosaminyl-diphospho-decaprenol L-rhamnosyltransferase